MEAMADLSALKDAIIEEVEGAIGVVNNVRDDLMGRKHRIESLLAGWRGSIGAAAIKGAKVFHLNIGGHPVDIAADMVDRSTLLGCLLKEQWRSLLLTDSKGRIFLDFDIEHMEPILDAMWIAWKGHHPLILASKEASNLAVCYIQLSAYPICHSKRAGAGSAEPCVSKASSSQHPHTLLRQNLYA